MSQALFYLLPANPAADVSEQVSLLACRLAQQYFQQGQWLYLHCEDQAQAYQVDELLWQFEPNAFVPHNLKGEGPKNGAPVEIGFDRLGPNVRRPVLINLATAVPTFAHNFSQILDFVAGDDVQKQQARERYRQYRAQGIALNTQDLATQPINFV
ncbi:DNA polymerase III subunit chi [Shewanella fodinae]|uniref:DNA polymerase III chi subunit n=1 Tax=Shewanella fodinae TaxID=552357 RepID=A0A4R2F6I2_9GAMM|nr:DNA polymerase III subunit chi [Shewanella fodinae]TCN81491.1 DNA polymerase III chi subunit [Shewanella fodinae]